MDSQYVLKSASDKLAYIAYVAPATNCSTGQQRPQPPPSTFGNANMNTSAMASRDGHLRAPLVMILSLMAAFLFAIGHHCLYHSLDSKIISSTPLAQQLNIAIGTTLAFLVKALILIAIGSAYSQVLWRTLTRQTLTVRTIDSLSLLLHDAWELLCLCVQRRHPSFLILAVIGWTIPLCTIVPPATLSVHSILGTHYSMRHVTTIDWTRGLIGGAVRYDSHNWMVSALRQTFVLAPNVAARGSIPQLAGIESNSSYRLEFSAPALHCQNAESSLLGNWSWHCGHDAMLIPGRKVISERRTNPLGYLSWIRGASSEPMEHHIPTHHQGPNGSVNCDLLSSLGGQLSYSYPDTPPQLFVAVQLFRKQTATDPVAYHNSIDIAVPEVRDLVECRLHHATYTVDFISNDGQQTLNVVERYLHPAQNTSEYLPPLQYTKEYEAASNTETNYLTLMNLIASIVVGKIQWLDVSDGNYKDIPQVINTRLMYTDEMIGLLSPPSYFHQPPLENGLLPDAEPVSEARSIGTLAEGLEQLFENITFAMFNSPTLTSKSELPVNVSTRSYQNVYSYSWKHLVASYGSGLFMAAIVVGVGCLTIFEEGVAYETRFSTFLRTVRWEEIPTISNYHHNGAVPVPETVASTKLRLGSSPKDDESGEDIDDVDFRERA